MVGLHSIHGSGSGPPVMVYDRARDRTVLYGGIRGPSDTWEWDGSLRGARIGVD